MKKEEVNRKFVGEVTYFQVLLNDIISFLIGIFYLLYISILLIILISVFVFGADAPKESALEMILGFVIITGVFIFLLKLRISTITEILRNGDRINAEVVKGLSHEFFVHLTVQYSLKEEFVKKKLLLPNTKNPRSLIKYQNLTILVSKKRIRKIIIYDLYLQHVKKN